MKNIWLFISWSAIIIGGLAGILFSLAFSYWIVTSIWAVIKIVIGIN